MTDFSQFRHYQCTKFGDPCLNELGSDAVDTSGLEDADAAPNATPTQEVKADD